MYEPLEIAKCKKSEKLFEQPIELIEIVQKHKNQVGISDNEDEDNEINESCWNFFSYFNS